MMYFSWKSFIFSIHIICIVPFSFGQQYKILCLHGGGGSADGFQPAIAPLENALPNFEFVYVDGGYGSGGSYLWMNDPPGGKDSPTTDPNWADDSIDILDNIRSSQGPFHGILGYSQGAAFVSVYLSRVPDDTFQFAITFCGYLPETHLGIMGGINDRSPFNGIPHLVWLGAQDTVITNGMTLAMSEEYTNPNVVTSNVAGHYPPGSGDPTFSSVVSWIENSVVDGPTSTPVFSPTMSPVSSPQTSPPTSSPVSSPTPGVCVDSELRFLVNGRSRTCNWVANKNTSLRCNKAKGAVAEHCPLTCDTCTVHSCTDASKRFYLTNGNLKSCTWVARKQTLSRCGKSGVSLTCRDTCTNSMCVV